LQSALFIIRVPHFSIVTVMAAHGFAQRLSAHLGARSVRRAIVANLVIIAAVVDVIGSVAHAADLSSAVIRGSTVYSPAELFGVYRDQLGKPISQASARAIVTELVAKYERDGYARPRVRLDDAMIGLGILRIDVYEARITDVKINGDPGPHLERLEHLGSKLRTEAVVREHDVQATLRRMRELPGLSLSATTARDPTEPNIYRLDLDTSFDPVSGAVRFSNRGTEEAGPDFLLGQIVANGLLDGQTNLGAMFAAATDYSEYHGVGMLANIGVGENAARIAVTGYESRSNPTEALADLDYSYVRDRATMRYTRPIAGMAAAGMTLFGGLKLDDLTIDETGIVLRDERLRMLELGSSWNWRTGTATQLLMSTELVKGLDGLGSELTATDLADDPRRADFTILRFNFTRATRFSERWSVRLDGFAQQTAYVLPYNERFKIGGDRLGRGFEVAEIAGDEGIGAKVELRRRLTNVPAVFGRMSIYGFYDVGAAWKQDLPGRESAATAGLGFASQTRRASGSIELAEPLTHPDVEGRTGLALFAELALLF
jgi:hemolysin activation/secretion protein